MYGSPAVATIASYGSLSLASDGIGLTTISKPSGITPFISFSSHVPHGRNAALPCSHSVCDSVWVRPSQPGSIRSLVWSSYSAFRTSVTASDFQALSSRLSIAIAEAGSCL